MADEDSSDSLLVFGYGCKIFDDEEKSRYIEEGKHLIAWNGLRIDRYDGRLHIGNLPPEGSRYSPDPQEAQYDSERYLSLLETSSGEGDEDNQEKTVEIGYDYSNSPVEDKAPSNEKIEEPKTQLSLQTLANVIEKTADFIVKEGAQMEILMRAKEADNPKFQFLNPDNPYHPIYKQVLDKKKSRLKSGGLSFPPITFQFDVEKSLRNVTLPSAAPGLGSSKPVSSGSSAYSKLVEKIRENQPPPPPLVQQQETRLPPPVTLPEVVSIDENVVEVVPPKDKELMRLIDKTASYLAKNGSDSMSVVRKRKPEEFAFLLGDHPNHSYFQYKIALYKEIIKSKKNGNEKFVKKTTSVIMPSAKDAVSIVEQKFPLLKGFFT